MSAILSQYCWRLISPRRYWRIYFFIQPSLILYVLFFCFGGLPFLSSSNRLATRRSCFFTTEIHLSKLADTVSTDASPKRIVPTWAASIPWLFLSTCLWNYDCCRHELWVPLKYIPFRCLCTIYAVRITLPALPFPLLPLLKELKASFNKLS